jgi:hypothetical protein
MAWCAMAKFVVDRGVVLSADAGASKRLAPQ